MIHLLRVLLTVLIVLLLGFIIPSPTMLTHGHVTWLQTY